MVNCMLYIFDYNILKCGFIFYSKFELKYFGETFVNGVFVSFGVFIVGSFFCFWLTILIY